MPRLSAVPSALPEAISPLSDYVFSLLFGDRHNTAILAAFLKSVLNLPEEEYRGLTVANPILKRRWKKDKLGIVDVLVYTVSGRVIQVEVQVNRFIWMKNRILYYLARLVEEQMKGGYNYDRIHEVISIVICDHVLESGEEEYMNEYALMNTRNGKPFTELIKVVTLELPKLPGEPDGGKAWQWGKFFRSRSREELEAVLEMAKGTGG